MNTTWMSDERRAESIARVLSRAHAPNALGCRLWKDPLNEACTYPQISMFGEKANAHHWLYSLCVEDVPRKMVVMHSCNNKTCVAIEHLSLGTSQKNALDAIRDGLRTRSRYRWIDDEVRDMRISHWRGESINSIASRYEASPKDIYRIVTRRRRANVPDGLLPFEVG